jgi:DnaJ family protein C protein 3
MTGYEVAFHISREVRECLRLDPEHKDCFPHYKIVKKVDKLIIDAQEDINNRKYQDCIDSANKVRVIFMFF